MSGRRGAGGLGQGRMGGGAVTRFVQSTVLDGDQLTSRLQPSHTSSRGGQRRRRRRRVSEGPSIGERGCMQRWVSGSVCACALCSDRLLVLQLLLAKSGGLVLLLLLLLATTRLSGLGRRRG